VTADTAAFGRPVAGSSYAHPGLAQMRAVMDPATDAFRDVPASLPVEDVYPEVLRKMMIAGAEVSVVNLSMWRPARPVVGDALSLGRESGEGTHSCGRSGAGHGLAVATGQHGGFELGQPFD